MNNSIKKFKGFLFVISTQLMLGSGAANSATDMLPSNFSNISIGQIAESKTISNGEFLIALSDNRASKLKSLKARPDIRYPDADMTDTTDADMTDTTDTIGGGGMGGMGGGGMGGMGGGGMGGMGGGMGGTDTDADTDTDNVTDGSTAADGAELYANQCAGCHGELSATDVSGASADKIKDAISKVGVMKNIVLTDAELSAIAQML